MLELITNFSRILRPSTILNITNTKEQYEGSFTGGSDMVALMGESCFQKNSKPYIAVLDALKKQQTCGKKTVFPLT